MLQAVACRRRCPQLQKPPSTTSMSPWDGREAFDAVRALIAVSAARRVREALHRALGSPEWADETGARLRFEQARWHVRMLWLDTVALWLGGWPVAFRLGATEARLTQRSFARVRLPPQLEAEVARLPLGRRRHRRTSITIEDAALRKLRRIDAPAYLSRNQSCSYPSCDRPGRSDTDTEGIGSENWPLGRSDELPEEDGD